MKQIAILGITVVMTFGILWYPFYHYRHDLDQTVVDVFGIILRRIFPFSRGLFEGKVGNLWCVASVKPISIRERLPPSIQPLCALALTLLMVLPFCVILFCVGKNGKVNDDSDNDMKINSNSRKHRIDNLHLKVLLWGAAGSSLSFFLASFQVHEKSILLPLAPLSILISDEPMIIHWFAIVCIWSMWHLLVVDRLRIAYLVSIIIYLCYVCATSGMNDSKRVSSSLSQNKHPLVKWDTWDEKRKHFFSKCILPLSISAMIGLHILEALITPPRSLPDLFQVLWVIVSCFSFCFMWLTSLWKSLLLLSLSNATNTTNKKDVVRQKKD
jgi:alpha-1,3-glucosyltransferase